MKIIGIVAVVALLAGPAWAQTPSIQKYGDPDKVKTQADIAAEKEAERAYKRSLGNIPEQKTSSDPWGAVRSDNAAPKAAAKVAPAKPKAAKTDAKSEATAKQQQ
jgi:hypothetical protein